jgi:hypothetical protein
MKKTVRLLVVLVIVCVLLGCSGKYLSFKQYYPPDKKVINIARERCVRLMVYEKESGEKLGEASGVIIDSNSVLTARHCIDGFWIKDCEFWEKDCEFYIKWQDQEYQAQVVECEMLESLDVALLEVEDKIFPVEKLAPTDMVVIGDWLFWFDQVSRQHPQLSFGEVSGVDIIPPSIWPYPCLRVDREKAFHGMSGSAVYDFRGRLVGILVGGDFTNFPIVVVPVKYFKTLLQK